MNIRKIKILVVEDCATDRIMMLNAIGQSGFNPEVSIAESIDEALEMTSTKTFDCILLDYYFPEKNGIDFIRSYTQKKGKGSIIMVTSQDDVNMAVECMKMGASDYLTKNQITAASVTKSLNYVIQLKQAKENAERAEQALMESEIKLKSIIARSPVIIFNINDEGKITLFKGKATSCLEIKAEKLIGLTIHEVTGKTPIHIDDYKKACKEEELHFKKEINGRHFDVNYIPVKDQHKNISGMMGVAIDVTSFRKNEEELIHTIASTETTARIQEEFLANMSHEIRTPIHGIISLTQFVLNSELDEDQRQQLGLIKKSAETLLVIVNDILDLSKIDADKMTFEQIRFNIRDTIKAAVASFIPKTIEKNIQLKTEFATNLPEELIGDPVRLTQIINNLLGNAIKFTEKGHVSIGASIIDQNEENMVIGFCIRDTGIGIPANKMNSIFESFTQASEDTTRKFGGTGLGLSITKKLVEKQNGEIHVQSSINEGSSFTINIPYKIAGIEIPIEATIMKATSEFDRQLNILVAEDNDINRFIIEKMLLGWGMKVDFAATGIEAVQKSSEKEFDLILMDVEMPDMNGYRATEIIRNEKDAPLCEIPIIAMTGHAMAGEREKCIACGMDDYISKPFKQEELKEKIIFNAAKALTINTSTPSTLISDAMSMEDIQQKNSGAEIKTASTNPSDPGMSPTDDRLINLQFLREISENNEQFFREFITMFLLNTPKSVNDMNEAHQHNDWEQLRQAAHKVKPSFNYVGLKELNQLSAKVEEFAKQKINAAEITIMLARITAMSIIAYRQLEEELNTSSIS